MPRATASAMGAAKRAHGPRDRSWDGMKRRSAGLGLTALLGALAAACSPLLTFDRLVPKDRAGTLIAKGLPYGPG
ncbi:hypothetical protein AAIO73_20040, partial [Sphingomonas sp. T9W2]